MGEGTDVDGARFSEDDINRWAAEAESDRGYAGGHLGPSRAGTPVRAARIGLPRTEGTRRPAENPSVLGGRA